MMVDLLRPAFRISKRKVSPWTITIALESLASWFVVALLLAIVLQSTTVGRAAAKIDWEMAALYPQWTSFREQTQEVQRLQREIEAFRKVLGGPAWLNLLESLRVTAPPGVWLAGLTADESGALEVVLRTTEPGAIGVFLDRLHTIPALRDIRLALTETVTVGTQELLQAKVVAQVVVR